MIFKLNLLWKKQYWNRFPWGLFLTLILLTAASLLFIESASYNRGLNTTLPYTNKQIGRLVPSLLLLFFLSVVSLRRTEENAFFIYFLGIVSLLAVFLLGRSAKGAARWIPVGPIRIQPSEFMKLCLILGLAKYFSGREFKTWKSLVMPLILTFVPLFLVLKQPDLGTSLLFIPILFALLYAKGAPLRYLIILALTLSLLGLTAWELNALNRYQKDRVYAFLYPDKYAQTIAYQPIQSQIAIGSGGFWGKGIFQGSQTQLNFLPERHTDFIFAVISEEWGFVGALFILLLIFLMVFLILDIGCNCPNEFGALTALGIGVLIGLQAFINAGIAMGIMPVTGLTLPFVSYGGSSTLMFWMSLGMVIQVRQQG